MNMNQKLYSVELSSLTFDSTVLQILCLIYHSAPFKSTDTSTCFYLNYLLLWCITMFHQQPVYFVFSTCQVKTDKKWSVTL